MLKARYLLSEEGEKEDSNERGQNEHSGAGRGVHKVKIQLESQGRAQNFEGFYPMPMYWAFIW